MIQRFYKKIRLNPDPDLFTALFVVALLSLCLGIYNNYQIRNGAGAAVALDSNGQKVLPLKDLIKNINPSAKKIGNPDAKVVMVEFEDFQCPFCKKFNKETFPLIKKKYIDTGKVLFIHQDLAFLGLESNSAAESAHCAGDQGKFWEYRQYLYDNHGGENLGAFNDNNLKKFAKNLGLDTSVFNACFDSGKYKDLVNQTKDFARGYGITATPTFVINGQIVKGAMGMGSFETMINNLLEN